MKYEQQFLDAIAGAGYEAPTKLIADGELHRFSSNGKPNDDSGWYVCHGDYLPAGSFGCWRDGQTHTWRADIGRDYSSDEQLFMRERMEAQRQKREAEKEARQKEAKLRARNTWSVASKAGVHGYLTRKGVQAHGIKRQGAELVIPMRQGNEITSLQFITAEGDKRFLSGGKVQGSYFSIGNPDGAPALCVCEGFATGASIYEATGLPVAVAFNAGNLLPVAETMRSVFPALQIVICADDDYLTEGNTGIAKANEAARKVGGRVAVPQFGEKRPDKATDFNDLALHLGNEAVKACIDAAVSDSNAGGEATPLPDDGETPSRTETADEWGKPLPIPSGLLPVEPFDPLLLPVSVRDWVKDISERMQCPPDFTAVGVMVSLSSLIGLKACIQPKRNDSWKVMPNLWGVVVGRPGVMKSPALSETIKPLDVLAAKANADYAEKMAEFAVQKAADELLEKGAMSNASKAAKNGNRHEVERMLRESGEVMPLEEPVLRRYKVVDATYESLGQVLIENPLGVLVYRDEITGLLKSLDKEGQEGARAFYLQGYDANQSYTFDRIMRGNNLTIPAVCISMLGGIQPAKLKSYIHEAVKGGAGDDGLLQRFGLLVWPDVPNEWRNVDKFPDTEAQKRAFAVFERLDAMQGGVCDDTLYPAPNVFRFTPEAQDLFDEWRNEFEPNIRKGENHPAMESHLSKYRKLVPAVALVCSLADGESAVSRDSLVRALGWAEYLQSHAERAYGAGMRPVTDGATALLKKIRSGAVVDGFKPHDVYNNGWAHLPDKEAFYAAAEMLQELGYLREVEIRKAVGRPSKIYLINPLIQVEKKNG